MLANVTKKTLKIKKIIYIYIILCTLKSVVFFVYCLSAVTPDFFFVEELSYYIIYIICVVNCYYTDACLFSLDPLQCFPFMCFGETIIVIGWCTAHAQLFNFGLFMFCWFFFFCLFVTILMLVQKSMLCVSE